MTTIKAQAYAKINLTLHVTGQRDDGYHLLDSLVVFADIADQLTATSAPDLTLTVDGPFADGVPVDDTNLILRAAAALRAARGVTQGAALTLHKNLPHAAGIGSGSSDAAATLKMLAQLWGVTPLPDSAPQVAALGADVPVCLRAPAPRRMTGIGDVLTTVPALPDCVLLLVRPVVNVPTAAVFDKLATKQDSPMADVPDGMDYVRFIHWLAAQRNDLQAPAMQITPVIADVIADLQARAQVGFAGMSGSGATCFAVVANLSAAQAIADELTMAHPDWWITPARML